VSDAAPYTGTKDEHYNLVSVLYHALQGGETYEKYIRDAEEAGDDELAAFFRQVQDEDHQRADRAKKLLADRVGGGG
jgi:rubrerythrin